MKQWPTYDEVRLAGESQIIEWYWHLPMPTTAMQRSIIEMINIRWHDLQVSDER